MKSLPSSGWGEIERCRRALVIELVKERGEFRDAVEDLRQRWSVAARCQIPPSSEVPGALHFPSNAPGPVHGLEEGWQEWTRFLHEWKREIGELYKNSIPEPARLSDPMQSREWWQTFLSACVVYAPPEKKLEEYADSHRHIFVGTYDPEDFFRDDYPQHFMSRPPIVYTRRAEGVENAYRTYTENLAFRVAERIRDKPGADIVETVLETLRERDLDGPLEADWIENPIRAYIEVRPWQKEKDIISAFRMISAMQDRSGRSPDPERPLRAVQCAILHDRCGWKYEEIEAAYGWTAGSNVAGKYIKDGRRILSG